MPVEHVVIIVKENHTFENYFGTPPGTDGQHLARAANPPLVDPFHDHLTWMRRAGNAQFHVQYTSADIPDYFKYAENYTVSDHYFSEVAGPSTPNHLMICADAPIINNPKHQYNPRPGEGYDLPSLPAQLERAGLQWGQLRGLRLPLAGYRQSLARSVPE
ncbi:MAG: alkaline phosphatase family protein [Stellaceae bacterium]